MTDFCLDITRRMEKGQRVMKKIFIAAFLILAVVSVGVSLYQENNHDHAFAQDQPKQTLDVKKTIKKAPEQSTKRKESVIARKNVGIEIGNVAPDFTLPTIDGQVVSLSSLSGKKVILNFWATWCPPCRKEMPDIEAFYSKHAKDKHVVVLGINLTSAEMSVNDVKRFIKEYKLTFPVLLAKTEETAVLYQAVTIPTSYIIDSSGVIRSKKIGPMDQKWMEQQIDAIQ